MPRRRRTKKQAKVWYDVYAADIFPGQWLGETPASNPSLLIGRRVEVSLRDITGDFMHEKYKLWFMIYRVEGTKAFAKFNWMELNRDYLRSIVQRRTSRIDVQSEGVTKDGHLVRYFNIIITAVRIRHSQQSDIRKRVNSYMEELIPQLTLEELVRAAILGDNVPISSQVASISTKIAPIRNVEPRKIVVLSYGEEDPGIPEGVALEIESSSPGGGGG